MKKVYDLFNGDSKISTIINKGIFALISLNIMAVIIDSYKSVNGILEIFLAYFEIFSIIIFSLEYILRVLSSPYKYGNTYKFTNIIRYVLTPLALIDLLSILPFYIPVIIKCDLRFIRIIRVFRLIRVLKIKRYSKSIDLISRVLVKKRTDLIMTIIVIGIMILMSGSIMYFIENEVQPEVFPNIIDSSIWSLRTMVFLGYDTAPVTFLGQMIGIITTLLGLGWIAMPISIISSGFIEEIEIKKQSINSDTRN